MRRAAGALLLFTLIAEIAVPAAHGGGSYTVNDTRDASDGLPGDGKCETAPLSEVCTLRAAVEEGNVSEGSTTVVLPGGVYSLAKTGDLPSRRGLTLLGTSPASTVIEGGTLLLGNDLRFDPPKRSAVSIVGVTITHAGFVALTGSGSSGGGIHNSADLVMTNCILSENAASDGGGLFNSQGATARLINVTVAGNHALAGAGIFNAGALELLQSTVSGNSTVGVGSPGGGIALVTTDPSDVAMLSATDSLISGNGSWAGGGIYATSGAISLSNTVVSGNTADDRGGGLFVAPAKGTGQPVMIFGGAVKDNTAGQGGGFFLDIDDLVTVALTQTTISGNKAVAPSGLGPVGGAFFVRHANGDVHIANSTIADNRSGSAAGFLGGSGGAFYYVAPSGTLRIDRSTLNGNVAFGRVVEGGGGMGGNGGAVFSASANVAISNSTLSGNAATPGNDGLATGGGVRTRGGVLVLSDSTLAANEAVDGSAIWFESTLPGARIARTIVAGTCSGPLRVPSGGWNVESGNTCQLTDPTDLVSIDPRLEPLADNGGPTQTHALKADSPAIDAGGFLCPLVDQRGSDRKLGAACDAGAVEAAATRPAVTAILPAEGPEVGGTPVRIRGRALVGPTVTIGGAPCAPVLAISVLELECTTSPHAAGAADVVVTNRAGLSGVLERGFTYLALVAPVVVGIDPARGPVSGGTAVVVTGTGFATGATLELGGTAATSVVVESATRITAVTPPHPDGLVNVVVTNSDGGKGTLLAAFDYRSPPPRVDAINPTSGPSDGGTLVSLTGAAFQPGVRVVFGGVGSFAVTWIDEGRIVAEAPAHPPGAAAVLVINPDGQPTEAPQDFTYVAGPLVTSITPSSGPRTGGTTVEILGAFFQPGVAVFFGGVSAASVSFRNPGYITAVTPAHAVGAVVVAVLNPDGQSVGIADGFEFTSLPMVTSIAPTSGPTDGGTSVTITGSDFLPGVRVVFGGVGSFAVTWIDKGRIVAEAPAHPPGTVAVLVINPDGQPTEAPQDFTYVAGPLVTSITPGVGPRTGGTTVEILGAFFQPGVAVFFGGVSAASVNFRNPGYITAVTPAHAAGSVVVAVSNPDGQGVLVVDGFRFTSVPVVTSIVPAVGPTSGGTSVTITGSDFLPGVRVLFDGVDAFPVSSLAPTTAVTRTPPHAAGFASVVVVNPDGRAGAQILQFEYVAPPVLNRIKPRAGPAAGGHKVTLFGTGFRPGAAVLFDGLVATGVVVVTPSQIDAVTPAHEADIVDVTVSTEGGTGLLEQAYEYHGRPHLTAPPWAAGASRRRRTRALSRGPRALNSSGISRWIVGLVRAVAEPARAKCERGDCCRRRGLAAPLTAFCEAASSGQQTNAKRRTGASPEGS